MNGSPLRIREFEVERGRLAFPTLPRRKIHNNALKAMLNHCFSYLSFPENAIFKIIVAIERVLQEGVALLQQTESAF